MGGKEMEKAGVSVVKIDSSLMSRVEGELKKEENKFRFANKKQFIDIAVFEFLNKIENEKGGKKK